ncbi:RNA polymerase sigma factor SigM [Pseudonocardia benzenivorans]|uniref:RNA polymerase, sigma-24 subunit, ECF subfamily n=2 Tax=Pseudonocardia TaxID=1847 RepID=F4CXV8_PSEUX|nr:RNA polymerase sigma factor SigM [Pseudonocardia dioxanivorans]AEA28764.1 RNA polymerase, sigma-24 subunit, ECF subfamily [Pseudonocardia dioxanivorans CB1190]GJF01623.1 RNA polymerase sigma factor SigM [Pseudonocardia sp. D17]
MSAPALDDVALVAAHRAGDPQAFDELVRRHGDRLWAVALGVLRDREEARDAVQESLLTAFRRLDGFRGEAALSTWLHRILVNVCLDRLRRAQRRRTVPLPEHDVPDGRPDPGRAVATRLDVTQALATLPVDQRLAIELVDVLGHPVAEAARILDVPTGTVKSRCARGRLRLATLLGHLREES